MTKSKSKSKGNTLTKLIFSCFCVTSLPKKFMFAKYAGDYGVSDNNNTLTKQNLSGLTEKQKNLRVKAPDSPIYVNTCMDNFTLCYFVLELEVFHTI